MNWKKTSIIVTMGNDKYPKKVKATTYNNIVQDPTEEQIKAFVDGLLLLSDGDVYYSTQVIKHDLVNVAE
ncbi:hypothetical protein [Companilactobacillus kimchiensis]|uniref:DUF1659 domain-containing protein n=1 Tax=Companilactobacillus kimchiensis TaxID=993692 RepID=A0A0R2LLQ7_9LACO|nr:hypothetical protein [Companilactobacillus kimchiensis]KRO00320.1 hypothetical protein IV57_GL001423 [Companilactobacillus kimchiensis]